MLCFRCREPRRLNAMRMCPECTTLWLSATPADRRRLLYVVTP
jgi:hypothetical protein